MMADRISPADCALTAMPFSLNNFSRIVAVEPTGSERKYSGPAVSKLATRWWSMTSATVTAPMSLTLC